MSKKVFSLLIILVRNILYKLSLLEVIATTYNLKCKVQIKFILMFNILY